MAEHTLNTRILLKYDSYANWTSNNPVLKAGEMAIATVASNDGNKAATYGGALRMSDAATNLLLENCTQCSSKSWRWHFSLQ